MDLDLDLDLDSTDWLLSRHMDRGDVSPAVAAACEVADDYLLDAHADADPEQHRDALTDLIAAESVADILAVRATYLRSLRSAAERLALADQPAQFLGEVAA